MTMLEQIPIAENRPIAKNIYRLKLYSPDLCKEGIDPGQFFHIKCGKGNLPFLRRPLSLSYRLKDENCIALVYRVIGQGTKALANRGPGELLDVLGPLGNGFEIKSEHKNVLIIGGGIGIAPLVELTAAYKNKATVMIGFKEETFLIERLKRETMKVRVATEDGGIGHRGLVTDIFIEYLKERRPDIVFACGPWPMLKEVATLCKDKSIDCQVSLEERMACGIGACFGCSVATKDGDGDVRYSRVCKDGPVFWAEEVCWDE